MVTAPKGANIVSCKWVFKIKRSPDGQIERYKARLVARGFSQQHGVDYDETFAPVVRMETLRILLAIAAAEDLEIHQMDVVTAYLAGELEEEIYMTSPPGVPDTEGLVCRLWKGLYGLKQSARVWNQRLTGELKRMGLRATTADPSVWVSKDRGLILALYVDDIVLIARDPQELRRIKTALAQVFKMKDLGEIQNVLGLRVRRHRATRRLWIDQTHYIEDVLKEFGHVDCRTVSTPPTATKIYKRAPDCRGSRTSSKEPKRAHVCLWGTLYTKPITSESRGLNLKFLQYLARCRSGLRIADRYLRATNSAKPLAAHPRWDSATEVWVRSIRHASDVIFVLTVQGISG